MAARCEFHEREVIHVHARLHDQRDEMIEEKKFAVDPQVTAFETMLKHIAKAFCLQNDFAISYLATDNNGDCIYLSLLSDWDLEAAFMGSMDDTLRLKIDKLPDQLDLKDVEAWDLPSSKSMLKSRSAIGTRGALASIRTIFASGTHGSTSLLDTIADSIGKKVSKVQQVIGFNGLAKQRLRSNGTMSPPTSVQHHRYGLWKAPMTATEFEHFFDSKGVLERPHELRARVYQGGVEPAARRSIWLHLLNCFPVEMDASERETYLQSKSKEYIRIKERWKRECATPEPRAELRRLTNAVRKDVLRTDRSHHYFSGDDNKHVVELFDLLVTFALAHPSISYVQGMSDLAAPLLVVEQDEPTAYLCFCALFSRLARAFSHDGLTMETNFEHLRDLINAYDPVFFEFLRQTDSADLIFTYRWLLLELKREFPLDDACTMLEILWSSLPVSSLRFTGSPNGVPLFERGCMFDADVTPISATAISAETTGVTNGMRSKVGTQSGPIAHYAKLKTHFSSMKKRAQSDSQSQSHTAARCMSLRCNQLQTARADVADSNLHADASAKVRVRKALTDPKPYEFSNGNGHNASPNPNPNPVPAQIANGSDEVAKRSSSPIEDEVISVIHGEDTNGLHFSESFVRERTESIPESQATDSSEAYLAESKSAGDLVRLHDENARLVDAVTRSLLRPAGSTELVSHQDNHHSTPPGGRLPPTAAATPPGLSNVTATQHHGVSVSTPCSPMRIGRKVKRCAHVGDSRAIENLPPPEELGGGNPFLLFLCLTILVQHRDVLMATTDCECNDIGIYFSNLVRRHDVQRVISQAQALYATYLRIQQRKASVSRSTMPKKVEANN